MDLARLDSFRPHFPALGTLDAELTQTLAMALDDRDPIRAAEVMRTRGRIGVVLATDGALVSVYRLDLLGAPRPAYQRFPFEGIDCVNPEGPSVYVSCVTGDAERNVFEFESESVARGFAHFVVSRSPRLNAPSAPSGAAPPPVADTASIVRAAVQADVGTRLHLAPLPLKKAAHVSRILGGTSEPVVAFFDLTVFGGGADAVVITETRLVVSDGDARQEVFLAQVRSAASQGMLASKLAVRLDQGTVTIPCGDHAEPLARALNAIGAARVTAGPTPPSPIAEVPSLDAARACLRSGDGNGALGHLLPLTQAEPTNVRAFAMAGHVLLDMRRPDLAVRMLRGIVRADPDLTSAPDEQVLLDDLWARTVVERARQVPEPDEREELIGLIELYTDCFSRHASLLMATDAALRHGQPVPFEFPSPPDPRTF